MANSFWNSGLFRLCLSFGIPFLITFLLLVNHEKNIALDDLHRSPQLGQILNGPRDEIESWKMGAALSALMATPAGLLGLSGYGIFLLIGSRRRSKDNAAAEQNRHHEQQ